MCVRFGACALHVKIDALSFEIEMFKFMHDFAIQYVYFTHFRCSFSSANSVAVKLHNTLIPFDFYLAHCNRYCIEISFLPSLGIQPNVLLIFRILRCTLAIYMSNIYKNFALFSLLAFVFGHDFPRSILDWFESLAVSHTDCIPNKSVHLLFSVRKPMVFRIELFHQLWWCASNAYIDRLIHILLSTFWNERIAQTMNKPNPKKKIQSFCFFWLNDNTS